MNESKESLKSEGLGRAEVLCGSTFLRVQTMLSDAARNGLALNGVSIGFTAASGAAPSTGS